MSMAVSNRNFDTRDHVAITGNIGDCRELRDTSI
jgi:hypothetical protein